MDQDIDKMKPPRIHPKEQEFQTIKDLKDRAIIGGLNMAERQLRMQENIKNIIPTPDKRVPLDINNIIMHKRMRNGISINKKPQNAQDQ